MPEWIDKDCNIIGDLDPECWNSVFAFLHNASLPDCYIFGRVYESDIFLLKSAAKLCEEIALYYSKKIILKF